MTRVRDLTRLVDTRDCATPSCTREADSTDGLCHNCRALGLEPQPKVELPQPQVEVAP